ncbi:hypothetical protein HZC53_00025 [Candidatus Uhrbacteria bacterium]|nr:hypothetical protein [Candidatus Uhrbacteria bacterium]
MVYYFHTLTYIYAVTNGYCSQVFHADGDELSTGIVGSMLLGGLKSPFDKDVLPFDRIEIGMYLKFGNKDNGLVSDAIQRIEEVGSLSIPPRPRESQLPETIKIRDPVPTVPEILFPHKKEDGG